MRGDYGDLLSRQLMNELGRPQKTGTLLWEDNKACLIIAEGETSVAGRSKHIDIKFKYVTENITISKMEA